LVLKDLEIKVVTMYSDSVAVAQANPSLGSKPLSIILVEDHKLLVENLKMGIETKSKHSVLGTFYSPIGLFDYLGQSGEVKLPDVVVMDICMPEMDGLEATYRLKQRWPEIHVLMMTSLNDAKTLKEAMKVKATGFCCKEAGLDELLLAIETVSKGCPWIDSRMALFLLNQMEEAPAAVKSQASTTAMALPVEVEQKEQLAFTLVGQPALRQQPENVLNTRELEILKLIANGRSNKQIADDLKISEAWIAGYIQNIVNKLAVGNEIEAVELALSMGTLNQAPVLSKMDY
jgi:two-component system, NarL family, response regulator DegU